MKRPSLKKLQDQCDKFNKKYPVDTPVLLKKDFVDEPVKTRVTHAAYIMCGIPVAFFEGISGCYDIQAVKGIYIEEATPC